LWKVATLALFAVNWRLFARVSPAGMRFGGIRSALQRGTP
jgi:hypothetical protein